MNILVLIMAALASALTIPVHGNNICGGPVLYTVEYEIGECALPYQCTEVQCNTNMTECSGLSSNEAYECAGCTLIGSESWLMTGPTYEYFMNPTCTGEPAFEYDLTYDACFNRPGVACAGKGADISQITGYPLDYYGNYSGDGDGNSGRSTSSAVSLHSLIF